MNKKSNKWKKMISSNIEHIQTTNNTTQDAANRHDSGSDHAYYKYAYYRVELWKNRLHDEHAELRNSEHSGTWN